MKRLGLAIALVVALSCAAAAQIGGLMFPGPGPRIASAALACSYTPVTTGTQGTAYTGATPSASGGTPAYTFSETGTLPGGLSISSSTGVISGTPTANGSFPTIQVKVTDSTSTVANCGASFTLVIAPSGGSPTLAYIGAVTPSISGQVLTATSAPIGTAASDRLVVVLFTELGGTSETSATVTIGGTSAIVNAITNGPFPPCVGTASLVVTTGTTANIVVTLNGSGASVGHFEIYTIIGLSSMTAVGSSGLWDGSTDPLSTTLATSSGGVVIALGMQQTISSSTNTISGTETYTQDNTPINVSGSGFGSVAHATGTATNASSTVTFTTGQTGHLGIAAVSFR